MQGVFAVQYSGKPSDMVGISKAPLNPAYIEYKNNGQTVQVVKEIIFKEQLGYIPEPTDSSHTKGKKISKKDLKEEIEGISYVPTGEISGKSYLHLPLMISGLLAR